MGIIGILVCLQSVLVEVVRRVEKVPQVQFNVPIVDKQYQKIRQKKVTSRINLVEHQLAKELRAQGTYIASPKILKWYCISCAIHFKILKIRSATKRREHTKLR